MPLTIGRKEGESFDLITSDGTITVYIAGILRDQVRITIIAPAQVTIHRDDMKERR